MSMTIPPQQLALLRRVQEMEFVAVDLHLFLDTHPDDERALADYNSATAELRQLRDEYERSFSPLSLGGVGLNKFPWAWIEEPWPWEICY